MEKTEEALPKCEFAHVEKIDAIAYHPHPYMVGVRHVTLAAERYGGMLGEEVCRQLPCAWKGKDGNSGVPCHVPYEQHMVEKAAFVVLERDVKNKELGSWLFSLKPWAEEKQLAGFAFPNMNKPYKVEG